MTKGAAERALFELGRYNEAFEQFLKVRAPSIEPQSQEFIKKCMDMSTDLKLPARPELRDALELSDLTDGLHEFASHTSSRLRMRFWRKDGKKKVHKWVQGPEDVGKSLLISFLGGKYGEGSVTVVEEHRAGAGVIDLYVLLSSGSKVIIELKICGGSGYSKKYALTGVEQLVHYMSNCRANIGYLIVFDARIRDFGIGIDDMLSRSDKVIYGLAIDLRPTFR